MKHRSRSDVNALTSSEITARVRLACETNGFFIVRNHSVKQSTVREMHEASKLFYALPVKFKMRAKQNANNRGYSPIMEEKLDLNANGDSKEGFYIGPRVRRLGDGLAFAREECLVAT